MEKDVLDMMEAGVSLNKLNNIERRLTVSDQIYLRKNTSFKMP